MLRALIAIVMANKVVVDLAGSALLAYAAYAEFGPSAAAAAVGVELLVLRTLME